MHLSIGFSTCPNDTFIFDALINGKVDTGEIKFDVWMGDILELNHKALRGELDIVKVSYHTFGKVLDEYQLLDSGSAMGFGCGPLLVSKNIDSVDELIRKNLPVAIPGKETTANLLLGFLAPDLRNKIEMKFDLIINSVFTGEAAAGVIIHESRFTYQNYGLKCLCDLGGYWEEKTSLPVPLGAIVASRALGAEVIHAVDGLIRESVEYAIIHPESSADFVRKHAQEMDEKVIRKHIDLYVNKFSRSLGAEGRLAVKKLMEVGEEMGIFVSGTAEIQEPEK